MTKTGGSWTNAVLAGGLCAGALDMASAVLLHLKIGPLRVFQSVATGLLGKAAYLGGVPTAALGLVLHFAIALIVAAVFVTAARRWPILLRRPVLSGGLLGVGMYGVMNVAVVPLSRAFIGPPPNLKMTVVGLLVHVFLFGLPIALAAKRLACPRTAT